MRNSLRDSIARSGAVCGALAVVAAAALFAGCGGGGSSSGSGGTGGTHATSAILTGTLQGANGAPLSGYTVSFDLSTTITAVTNAQGQFTLTVPDSAITGSDKVDVFFGGQVVDVVPVTVSTTSTASQSIGLVAVNTPPGPPSL